MLWLDDFEPFLNQGVTLQTLREWQAGRPGRIVAATYGGKGSELIAGSSARGLATIASDVLQHVCEVSLAATTAGELGGLRSTNSLDTIAVKLQEYPDDCLASACQGAVDAAGRTSCR